MHYVFSERKLKGFGRTDKSCKNENKKQTNRSKKGKYTLQLLPATYHRYSKFKAALF